MSYGVAEDAIQMLSDIEYDLDRAQWQSTEGQFATQHVIAHLELARQMLMRIDQEEKKAGDQR